MIHLQHKVLSRLALEKFKRLNDENKEYILIKYADKISVESRAIVTLIETADLRTLRTMEKELNRLLTLQ